MGILTLAGAASILRVTTQELLRAVDLRQPVGMPQLPMLDLHLDLRVDAGSSTQLNLAKVPIIQLRLTTAIERWMGAANREEITAVQAECRVGEDVARLTVTKRGAMVAMANGARERLAVLVKRALVRKGKRVDAGLAGANAVQ